MLKTEFRRAIRIGIGLRPESLLQGAHWAECAVVRQQRTTNRASSFALDCRPRMLLATRILLYLAPMACGKIARDRRASREGVRCSVLFGSGNHWFRVIVLLSNVFKRCVNSLEQRENATMFAAGITGAIWASVYR